MTTEHPITPPPELVQQWWTEFERTEPDTDSLVFIATQAARWGADQELEACCEWLVEEGAWSEEVANLRAARRPNPPSLKKQALGALSRADKDAPINPLTGEVVALRTILSRDQADTIRRALEQLDD